MIDPPSIRALVITNGEYDSDDLEDLDGPPYDGRDFTRALEKYGAARVDRLRERAADEVQEQVAMFLKTFGPSETAVLYFSAHGFREGNRLRLAARNTRLDLPDSNSIDASWVREKLHECQAGAKVWILDCCHAAAGGYGRLPEELFKGVDWQTEGSVATKGVIPLRAAQGVGLAILAAASADQQARDGRRGSPFTRALVRGITTGEADENRDGWVSVEELANYVHDQLADQQRTRLFIEDLAGRIYLTRVIPGEPEPDSKEPEPVVKKDVRSPLRHALRDRGGPASAAVVAVLAGAGIQLARENVAGTAISAVLIGLLAYLGYVFVACLTHRLRKA